MVFIALIPGSGWSAARRISGCRTITTKPARAISKVGGCRRDLRWLAGHANLGTTARNIKHDADAQCKGRRSDLGGGIKSQETKASFFDGTFQPIVVYHSFLVDCVRVGGGFPYKIACGCCPGPIEFRILGQAVPALVGCRKRFANRLRFQLRD
jgi:hypothetical protein